MQLNFRDPSVICRLVISALSGISVLLLIAGTAVDEYVSASSWIGTVETSEAIGCRKKWDGSSSTLFGKTKRTSVTVYKTFEQMGIFLLIILLCASFLCLLQAVATGLNVLVLLTGKYQKLAQHATSAVTMFLYTVIIMVNSANFGVDGVNTKYKDHFGWGSSYVLLEFAFTFAVLNQLLIQLIAGSQLSTASFFAFVAVVKTPVQLIRFIIVIFTGILTQLMVMGTARDRYIGNNYHLCSVGTMYNGCKGFAWTFKERPMLTIILIVNIIICLLQIVSFVLATLHLTKQKFEKLLLPLLGLSVATTGLTITSLILVCIEFTSANHLGYSPASLRTSFNCLITAIVFGVVNTALNVGNMILTKKGSAPSPGLPPQPSPGGIPPPPQPL